ncbi:MAG: biotin transporter BioY, partial [Negativicoccus succinicivorans]|nr:biotin transporter BioY [Negativicoccus succinicivorans]
MFKGKVRSFWHYVAAGVFIGIPITYIGGVLGMMIVLHMSLWPAIVAGALPFIPGDILKTIVAAFIALKIRV